MLQLRFGRNNGGNIGGGVVRVRGVVGGGGQGETS